MQNPEIVFVFVYLSCVPLLLCSDLCPKVCEPCLEHMISCTFGGLQEIPNDLNMDTKKVTLIGHTFSQFSLSRQNFSRFSKPKYSIEQLSIRQSNIRIIHSQAFFDLSGLDTLDLSDNANLVIEERAFANLKLKYLTLDYIGSLDLDSKAFDDLLVSSLSIKNSSLEVFPFSLLKPLSKDLRKLFLSGNRIQSLSPKFEALFRQLTVLDLHGNPLICSCDLLWLSTTLLWRNKYYTPQSSSFSKVQTPTCASPAYLKGEPINTVPESEFDCNPPRLSHIEILFENLNKATLRCAASLEAKRAPVNISWAYLDVDGYSYPGLKQTINRQESSIQIDQRNILDRFVCWLFSRSGNVSVTVNINWPIRTKWKLAKNVTIYRNPFHPNIHGKAPDYQQSFFFKEQYSLLELLASVISTFILTMLLFIVVYRFYFYKAIKLKKEQLKKSGYATYEVGLYSDSQTYDIPQYPSFDGRRDMLQPVFNLPITDSHIVDYTNHRKL